MPEQNDNQEQRQPLSSAKRELLERRLKGGGAPPGGPQPIPRRSEGGALPLSFAQQRLWFLDQFEPGSSVYNVPRILNLVGPLDVAAMEKALTEIVRRHESLRTTFSGAAGEPAQIIGPPFSVSLPMKDLSRLSPKERDTAELELARENAGMPFDLVRGPLFRVRLIRLTAEEHRVFFTLHHIIADGWSIGLLSDEITALYDAFANGRPSPLPELPVQYADYAIWQRGWLSGDVLERQLSYWRRQLSGELPVLEIPADRPRPAVRSQRGAVQKAEFPESLSSRLRALGAAEGATLYMTLMAAFKTLLFRYTGQEDIIVGTAIAGRTRLETEKLIGFFVNTLPMRTRLSPDMPFRELLARERRVALEAFEHQEVPFERLVEELRLRRDLSSTPIVQTMFTLQNTPGSGDGLGGIRLDALEIDNGTSKFDLSLSITEKTRGMAVSFEYSTDLFEKRTVEAFVGHYRSILEGVAADPGQRLSQIPILDAAEKEQLAVWSGTATGYPRDLCIQQVFGKEAALRPDALAIVSGGTRMTYAELDGTSNRLARILRSEGVGADVPVGILAERSPEMIVGLLAILKAGGAYVPLDRSLPAERLQLMLRDTGARVLLVHGELPAALPSEGMSVIRLDRWQGESRAGDDVPVPQVTGPENLAYIMYTSGSTGRPKGVMIPHRAVVRLVKGTDYCSFGPEEVFLQLAPISFDASTFEIWGALLNGARLVIAPPQPPSFEQLGTVIASTGITTLWLTSAMFNQVVDHRPDALRGVKQLLTGGDVLSVPHVIRFLEKQPGTRLINGYGPTENTTFSCCYSISGVPPFAVSIPIGRPIANSRAYILDKQMTPVPVGVPGELCVGGDGLARGYLNLPDLTSGRFVHVALGGAEGSRLYRTGDRARFLPDGRIEFLGRFDDQVKIRGYRIEPGEIECVLGEHPSVGAVVVIVREDVQGEKRLVAYCVLRGGESATGPELLAYLKTRLPDYMVPSSAVILASLPLNASGKVDRRALPPPEFPEAEPTDAQDSPLSPAEEALAGIWSEILGGASVGVNDNFFELGGHSLLAMRVISRVRDVFRIEIPLLTLFEHPTVAGLALAISEKLTEEIENMSDEEARGQE
jgi:aspartate racemase